MLKTVVRYMCPACHFSVLGDPGESRVCSCSENMEPVSASVPEAAQAERLLRQEQSFANRFMKKAACAGARGAC